MVVLNPKTIIFLNNTHFPLLIISFFIIVVDFRMIRDTKSSYNVEFRTVSKLTFILVFIFYNAKFV